MDYIKNLNPADNLTGTSILGGFVGFFSFLAAMGLLHQRKNHMPVEGKVSLSPSFS